LPEAYRAAVDEVGRRKIFGGQITNLLTQFCLRLAKIREDELKQRELCVVLPAPAPLSLASTVLNTYR
jgi:hypothetical protein